MNNKDGIPLEKKEATTDDTDPLARARTEDPIAAMAKAAEDIGELSPDPGAESLVPDTADDQTQALQNILNSAKTHSRTARISSGYHLVGAAASPGLTLSFDDIHAEPPGQLNRPNICGEGMGSTLLRNNTQGQYALIISGKSGVAAHQYIDVRDFSFGGPGNGMLIKSSAFMRGENLGFFGKSIGLFLESVLSSAFSHMTFRSCTTGMYLAKGSGFSGVNAMRFSRADFGLCPTWGIHGLEMQTNVTFDGCNFEGCGSMGNNWHGGVALTFNGKEGSVGANFNGCYFESNRGGFDVQLNNIGDHYITHTFVGCNFTRVGNQNFVINNIRSIGKNRIVLIGCSFDAYHGYRPSRWHSYFTDFSHGAADITCIGCRFGSPVEQGILRNIDAPS